MIAAPDYIDVTTDDFMVRTDGAWPRFYSVERVSKLGGTVWLHCAGATPTPDGFLPCRSPLANGKIRKRLNRVAGLTFVVFDESNIDGIAVLWGGLPMAAKP